MSLGCSTPRRTCCKKSNLDWDDFMKIPGCSVSSHSDVKLQRPSISSASSPVDESNAPQRVVAVPQPIVAVAEPVAYIIPNPQVPFRTVSGLFKCRHAGCMIEYDPESNTDESCSYHEGAAGFRDTKKFWTCCEASSYDWDEFMRIPKCKTGKHEPKMIDA